jgi:hypothetical protein
MDFFPCMTSPTPAGAVIDVEGAGQMNGKLRAG